MFKEPDQRSDVGGAGPSVPAQGETDEQQLRQEAHQLPSRTRARAGRPEQEADSEGRLIKANYQQLIYGIMLTNVGLRMFQSLLVWSKIDSYFQLQFDDEDEFEHLKNPEGRV